MIRHECCEERGGVDVTRRTCQHYFPFPFLPFLTHPTWMVVLSNEPAASFAAYCCPLLSMFFFGSRRFYEGIICIKRLSFLFTLLPTYVCGRLFMQCSNDRSIIRSREVVAGSSFVNGICESRHRQWGRAVWLLSQALLRSLVLLRPQGQMGLLSSFLGRWACVMYRRAKLTGVNARDPSMSCGRR